MWTLDWQNSLQLKFTLTKQHIQLQVMVQPAVWFIPPVLIEDFVIRYCCSVFSLPPADCCHHSSLVPARDEAFPQSFCFYLLGEIEQLLTSLSVPSRIPQRSRLSSIFFVTHSPALTSPLLQHLFYIHQLFFFYKRCTNFQKLDKQRREYCFLYWKDVVVKLFHLRVLLF